MASASGVLGSRCLLLSPFCRLVRAKDFVSNPYGFQISLPPGFREQRADVVNIVAEFIEPQSDSGEISYHD